MSDGCAPVSDNRNQTQKAPQGYGGTDGSYDGSLGSLLVELKPDGEIEYNAIEKVGNKDDGHYGKAFPILLALGIMSTQEIAQKVKIKGYA